MPRMAPWTTVVRSTSPPAYRSLIAWYVSQNGWKASLWDGACPGSDGGLAAQRVARQEQGRPARTATSAIEMARNGIRRGSAAARVDRA